MTRELWAKTIQLNVTATYFVAQEFARQLVAAKRGGSIVITASTNGFQAEADSTATTLPKARSSCLIRSLAVSLADHGIRVNGIAPGLNPHAVERGLDGMRAGDLPAHYEKKILLGRIGNPDDCAGVVFLCSPAASYLREIITIDGVDINRNSDP